MKTLFTLGIAILSVAGVAAAQDIGSAAPIYCPLLTQGLSLGSRDSQTNPRGQVTELQHFLSDYFDLNPDDYITGYFGRLTRDNVRRFQCERMGICSGGEDINGWGYVGRMTRAAIASACGGGSAEPSSASCVWNGQTIAPSASVIAYQSASVPFGSSCVAETRICQNGVLSGSYQYASCSVGTASTCSWNGQTIQNGQSVTAYQAPTATSPDQCQSQVRICTNGALSGNYQYAVCNVQGALSCTLDGVMKNSGESYAFYSTRTSANCDAILQSRTCQNGAWSGNAAYQYANCTNTTTATPSITITAPLEGAVLPSGNPVAFYWHVTNAPAGAHVRLAPVGICGPNVDTVPVNSPYIWNPGSSTGQCRVQIYLVPPSGPVVAYDEVIFTLSGSGGTAGNAPACTLTALPASIQSGQSSTLTLSSQNATSATIDNGVGTIAVNGAKSVSPTQTTTYFATVTGAGGVGTCQATVSVVPATAPLSASGGGTSCIYKGVAYGEGEHVQIPLANSTSIDATCDNGYWTEWTTAGIGDAYAQYPLCTFFLNAQIRSDANCSADRTLAARGPLHGPAPFTLTARLTGLVTRPDGTGEYCNPATVSWGDGATETISGYAGVCQMTTRSHTFTQNGTFTVSSVSTGQQYQSSSITQRMEVRVRVGSGSASAGATNQLANAYTALQSALQMLLQFIGR